MTLQRHVQPGLTMMLSSYDEDFYTWIQDQVALLRTGRLEDLDVTNLIEELESMGKNDQRALGSRLEELFLHLLKWMYQRNERVYHGKSWRDSIDKQREGIEDLIADSPSLKRILSERQDKAYDRARRRAATQTGLPISTFPERCPWDTDRALDPTFLPD